jgi:hypothetical protein
MGKFKIQKSATVNQGFDATNVIGGTGGLTSISGNQIRPNVFVTGSAGYGSILAQKGRGKFLVQDASANKGQCTLANLPNANIAAGQMSISVDLSSFAANVGNLGISAATSFASVIYSNANILGVASPTIGSTLTGVGTITGNVTITSIAAYGTNGSNANVSINSQIVANAATATVSSSLFAARLTNKFVQLFNGNEYQWTFNAPTSTTVRIPGA